MWTASGRGKAIVAGRSTRSLDRMSWIAAAGLVFVLLGSLVGYLLPRVFRVMGWVVLVGSIPVGMAAFRSGASSGNSCGEMMSGVCQLFAIGMGAAAGVAVGLTGVGLLLGAVVAGSRSRRKMPVMVEARTERSARN
jgi:hypothetical protein